MARTPARGAAIPLFPSLPRLQPLRQANRPCPLQPQPVFPPSSQEAALPGYLQGDRPAPQRRLQARLYIRCDRRKKRKPLASARILPQFRTLCPPPLKHSGGFGILWDRHPAGPRQAGKTPARQDWVGSLIKLFVNPDTKFGIVSRIQIWYDFWRKAMLVKALLPGWEERYHQPIGMVCIELLWNFTFGGVRWPFAAVWAHHRAGENLSAQARITSSSSLKASIAIPGQGYLILLKPALFLGYGWPTRASYENTEPYRQSWSRDVLLNSTGA